MTNNTQACRHEGINWNGEGECITCARDKVLRGDTQELDELVEKILEPHFDENELSRPDWTPEWSIYQNTKSETRQALLDWHNKQIDKILAHDFFKYCQGCSCAAADLLEAERNKLKGETK